MGRVSAKISKVVRACSGAGCPSAVRAAGLPSLQRTGGGSAAPLNKRGKSPRKIDFRDPETRGRSARGEGRSPRTGLSCWTSSHGYSPLFIWREMKTPGVPGSDRPLGCPSAP